MKTTSSDIIHEICTITGLTRSVIRNAMKEITNVISDIICKGNGLTIKDFGKFYHKKCKARPARNPRTGERVMLKERYVPRFKFSKTWKHKFNINISEWIKLYGNKDISGK